MPRITLRGLGCDYCRDRRHRVTAVAGVDLEIGDREFLVVLGPSGAGKTTLLRLIAGLERPSRGTLAFDGQVITETPPEERDVAMVFQSGALFPHLTVGDNLSLGLVLRGVPRSGAMEQARSMATRLGIGELWDRWPEALSAGERQQVALGRALVRRPSVLLLDEPLGNLDAPLRREMLVELLALHKEVGITTLYVTHDQQEALSSCHRIALMNRGQVEQVGDSRSLLDQPRTLFAASFMGNPPMNLIAGGVECPAGGWVFRPQDPGLGERWSLAGQGEGMSPGSRVMGLRAQDLVIEPSGAFPAVVEAVAPIALGGVLRLRAGQTRCFVFDANADISWVSSRVRVTPQLRRGVWFDAATGKRMGESGVEGAG